MTPIKLVLVVPYRTPSLNVTKRQHWTAQYKEKLKAYNALESVLRAAVFDPLTRITSPEVSKIYSTAFATLVSYMATNRGASYSKRSRSK